MFRDRLAPTWSPSSNERQPVERNEKSLKCEITDIHLLFDYESFEHLSRTLAHLANRAKTLPKADAFFS